MSMTLRISLSWLVVMTFACGSAQEPIVSDGRPNIVLITLDTTRADHLGTYGYFRDTSPHRRFLPP